MPRFNLVSGDNTGAHERGKVRNPNLALALNERLLAIEAAGGYADVVISELLNKLGVTEAEIRGEQGSANDPVATHGSEVARTLEINELDRLRQLHQARIDQELANLNIPDTRVA